MSEENSKDKIITRDDFEKILRSEFMFNIPYEKRKEMLNSNKKIIDTIFNSFEDFEDKDFSTEEVKNIILGAKKLQKFNDGTAMMKETLEEVQLAIEKGDVLLLEEIEQINNKFYKYFYDGNGKRSKDIKYLIKMCWEKTFKIKKKENKDFSRFCEDTLNKFEFYSDLYTLLNYCIGERKVLNNEKLRAVDELFKDKIIESATIINMNNPNKRLKEFKGFLSEISKKDGLAFDSDEIYDLLANACITLLDKVKVKQWEKVSEALNNYIDKVIEIGKSEGKDVSGKDKLGASVKTILKQCVTVSIKTAGTVNFSTSFLLGDNLNTALENYKQDKIKDNNQILRESFGNLKINGMNYNTHKYILNNNPTALADINSLSIYNMLDEMLFCLCKAYDLPVGDIVDNKKTIANKIEEINIDEILTKDNIIPLIFVKGGLLTGKKEYKHLKDDEIEQFMKEGKATPGKNLVDNIKLLKKFVSNETINNILKHNIELLFVPKKKNEEEIKKIAFRANSEGNFDRKQFNKDLKTFINADVDIEQEDSDKEKVKKQNVASTNKGHEKDVNRSVTLDGRDKIDVKKFVYDINTLKELVGPEFEMAVTENVNKKNSQRANKDQKGPQENTDSSSGGSDDDKNGEDDFVDGEEDQNDVVDGGDIDQISTYSNGEEDQLEVKIAKLSEMANDYKNAFDDIIKCATCNDIKLRNYPLVCSKKIKLIMDNIDAIQDINDKNEKVYSLSNVCLQLRKDTAKVLKKIQAEVYELKKGATIKKSESEQGYILELMSDITDQENGEIKKKNLFKGINDEAEEYFIDENINIEITNKTNKKYEKNLEIEPITFENAKEYVIKEAKNNRNDYKEFVANKKKFKESIICYGSLKILEKSLLDTIEVIDSVIKNVEEKTKEISRV